MCINFTTYTLSTESGRNSTMETFFGTLLLVVICTTYVSPKNNATQVELPTPLCEGGTCRIRVPNDFLRLKNNSHSKTNLLIIVNDIEITINGINGFVVLANLTNVTITGQKNGSSIKCSPMSNFGLHLKNATNVTIKGFKIKNCGSFIPIYIVDILIYNYVNCPNLSCECFFIIESSQFITLSEVNTEYSPGIALLLIDIETRKHSEDPSFLNLGLTNCTISNNVVSLVLHGKVSVLVEKTVIAYSSIGIQTVDVNLLIRNVDIINCTHSQLGRGTVIMEERLAMNYSSLKLLDGTYVYIRGCRVLFFGDNPMYWSYSALAASYSYLYIEQKSVVMFTGFNFDDMLYIASCIFNMDNSTMVITGNTISRSSNIMNSHIQMANYSSLVVTNNTLGDGVQGIFFLRCLWRVTPDSYIIMSDCVGVTVFVRFSNITYGGPVIIANNTLANDAYGILNIVGSRVEFQGTLEAVGNRAGTGAIAAFDSDISFMNETVFAYNYGINGGALALISSYLHISPNVTVDFTRNQAKYVGGAIFIFKPRTAHICEGVSDTTIKCSIQGIVEPRLNSCYMFKINFYHNWAGTAGNAIYGGHTSACMPLVNEDICTLCQYPELSDLFHYSGVNDSSDFSSFTSDPTRVCFCENGIPSCYKVISDIAAYPGEHFQLSVVTVGYGLGTVPGSVIAREQV